MLVFAYALSLGGESVETFYETYGIVPSKVTALEAYGFLERTAKYFSSMFIHENWIHIVGNLIFLYIFGNAIEDLLGHAKYLFFYLISGLVAVFIHITLNSDSTIPIIGASGAISGVLGIYMLFFPKSKILTLLVILFIRIRAYLFIIFWFAVQFLTGIGYIGDARTDSLWTHLVGFVCGVVIGGGFLYTRGYRSKKYKGGYGTDWYGENRD